MILVDTSVWVDHLRNRDPTLTRLLNDEQVAAHPFVIGEIALGHLRQRDVVLTVLQDLPQVEVATDPEVLEFIHRHSLFGTGIGYVDSHLLASVRLTPWGSLLTRDRRLQAIAERLGISAKHG